MLRTNFGMLICKRLQWSKLNSGRKLRRSDDPQSLMRIVRSLMKSSPIWRSRTGGAMIADEFLKAASKLVMISTQRWCLMLLYSIKEKVSLSRLLNDLSASSASMRSLYEQLTNQSWTIYTPESLLYRCNLWESGCTITRPEIHHDKNWSRHRCVGIKRNGGVPTITNNEPNN